MIDLPNLQRSCSQHSCALILCHIRRRIPPFCGDLLIPARSLRCSTTRSTGVFPDFDDIPTVFKGVWILSRGIEGFRLARALRFEIIIGRFGRLIGVKIVATIELV